MKYVRTALFFVLLVSLWSFLSTRHLWDPTLFPSPGDVGKRFLELVHDGTIWRSTYESMRRVLEGFAISFCIGLPLGIFLARVSLAEETIGAVVSAFQSLPSICWLPIAILWFGLNDTAILFVVVMGSLVSIAVAVKDGVRNLPPSYVRAALTMGTAPVKVFIDVLFPASQPAILIGAKIGWSYAWRALMSGELIFTTVGLGKALSDGRDTTDMAQVFCVMGVIMGLGLFVEQVVFAPVENSVRRRWGLNKL
jgi:NitT/TauT family transport system permease protein